MSRYRIDTDIRLRWPLSLVSFCLEKPKKEIVSEAVASLLECHLEEMIYVLHGGNLKGANIGIATKEELPMLEKALLQIRKVREETE